NDFHIQKRKGHPNRQGVNAGGHRQGKHRPHIHGGRLFPACFLFLRGKGLPHHVSANQSQQNKGNPVVHRSNHIFKLDAQQIPGQRHQRLKTPEPQSRQGALLPCTFFHGKSLTDRNGKRVHGKTHCQQKKFRNTHPSTSVHSSFVFRERRKKRDLSVES